MAQNDECLLCGHVRDVHHPACGAYIHRGELQLMEERCTCIQFIEDRTPTEEKRRGES